MASFIQGIISITIGAVILANVFISTVKATNTTPCTNATLCGTAGNWTTTEIAMWGLLSLVGVVGMVYGVLNVFGLA